MERLSSHKIMLAVLILMSISSCSLFGASITGSVDPGNATSNSLFKYTATIVVTNDEISGFGSAMLIIDGTKGYTINLTEFLSRHPEAIKQSVNNSTITYTIQIWKYLSAGLKLNPLYGGGLEDLEDTEYCSLLTADTDSGNEGEPKAHEWQWVYVAPGTGDDPKPVEEEEEGTGPTVHDSFFDIGVLETGEIISPYGGVYGDRDYIYHFPFQYPNMSRYIDPLRVEPYNMSSPDEGTSSNDYKFQFHYCNMDNLPPLLWWTGDKNDRVGTTLYIGRADVTNDPNFDMWRMVRSADDPGSSYRDPGYIYTGWLVPLGGILTSGPDVRPPWIYQGFYLDSNGHYRYPWYVSLYPGRYQYFFACSDDDLWHAEQHGSEYDQEPPYSPSNLETISFDGSPVVWQPDPGWGYHNVGLHTDVYVDRITAFPGQYFFPTSSLTNGYPYPSWDNDPSVDTYPEVNPGLEVCYENSELTGNIEYPLGRGRSLGSLYPQKDMVNPWVPLQLSSGIGSMWSMWSETFGISKDSPTEFRIVYKNSNGELPVGVWLCMSNGWYPNPWTWNGLPNQKIEMGTVSGLLPTADEVKEGVVYKCTWQTNVGGPHFYWFEASDGKRTVRFPRRPDEMTYQGAVFTDANLPSIYIGRDFRDHDNNSQTPLEFYGYIPSSREFVDAQGQAARITHNDIISGPYVNNKCVLEPMGVTPTSGSAGTDFVFRVRYTDIDGPTTAHSGEVWDQWSGPRGQRPKTAYIYIQTEDGGTLANGGVKRYEMQPIRNIDGSYDENYTDGAVYELHTATINGLSLKPGARRYYFEFTDDWGRPNDGNVSIAGETTTTPWQIGPTVSPNTRPLLVDGRVTSGDGTSNEATIWTYSVKYIDNDNQLPSYRTVYIGQVDPDTGELIWDAGHQMAEADSGDRNCIDGKLYTYSTTLEGNSASPIQYYYSFDFSDGVERTQYNAVISPSATTIWSISDTSDPECRPFGEELESYGGSNKVFKFDHKPLVGDMPPGATTYTDPQVYVDGVRKTSDISFDYNEGTVSFTSAQADTVSAEYLFGVHGPDAVTGNTAPTLYDGRVEPERGDSNDTYTFEVYYKDTDGENGQAPDYVRLVLDGQTNDMNGSGVYRQGVKFQVQLNNLQNGTHHYYFEASDGAGYAIFDGGDPQSRTSDEPFTGITPIEGPYVNDGPSLSGGLIDPNDLTNGHSTSQHFTYKVKYTAPSGTEPNSGYPVVYIDNPTEEVRDGTATAVTATTITDSSADWTTDEFIGLPLQITSGKGLYLKYIIMGNTSDTITVVGGDPTDMVRDGIRVGDTFSIGKLFLQKTVKTPPDADYTDGMDYEVVVPGLGVGRHSAHFRCETTETIGGVTTPNNLRFPYSGEIDGPLVSKTAPPGNHAPVLKNTSHTPPTGTSAVPFTFMATYSDADGDSPTVNEQAKVQGFMRVVIDGIAHDMTNLSANPDYVAGVNFNYITTLTPGRHDYHFEASDGWVIVRAPSSGEWIVNVNRPPVLSEAAVTPEQGNTSAAFEYSVKLTDADNEAPEFIHLVIDGGTPSERDIDIKSYATGSSHAAGVVYKYTLPEDSPLYEGTHRFYFVATDEAGESSQTTEISKPFVYPSEPPILSDGVVNPASGYQDEEYTYTVTYTDTDGTTGDPPAYVKVYIDGSAEANAHEMTRVDDTDDDYTDGVVYQFMTSSLSVKMHNYFFKTSDGIDTVQYPSDPEDGPNVSRRPTAAITLNCPTSATLGERVTVTGTINPPMAVNLKVKFTSPEGDVGEYTVASTNTGAYSCDWVPDVSGTWKVQTTWVGGGNYLASSSTEKSVDASLTCMVNGLDMISVPIQPVAGFPPENTFGSVPPTEPYVIVKWLPSKTAYRYYSLMTNPDGSNRYRTDFDFPWISAGQAYWIKTDAPKVISPKGSLVSTSSNYTIQLGVGWNQVGNPFTSDIDWSSLRVIYNGVSATIADAASYGWIRSYGWTYDPAIRNYKLVRAGSSEDTMRSWRGYWVRALSSCKLVVPVPTRTQRSESNTINRSSASDLAAAGNAPKWQVQAIVKNGNSRDESNFFGQSSSADELIESPACIEDYVDLFFTDKNGSGVYAIDLREDVKADDKWQFIVSTDISGMVELTWAGLETVPSKYRLILVDETAGKSVEISAGSSYTFFADNSGEGRCFQIKLESK